MPVQHPYHNGYSVLPNLRKIPVDEVFAYEPLHFERCLTEKRIALETQNCCLRHRLDITCERELIEWIEQHYPVPLSRSSTLDELIVQVQEDVIVHCADEHSDWMAYGHVSFPSGWLPEEKIGKNFEEIHKPVAGMDLSKSRQLVNTMIHYGPFERFVWSVVFEDAINFHPYIARKKFDPMNPQLWVKVERQVTVGFSHHNAVLFLLNQYLIPEREIDKPALCCAIETMTAEQKAYKGMTQNVDQMLRYLEETSSTRRKT